MEIVDFLMVLSILSLSFGMILYLISRYSPPKKAKRAGDSSISDLYEVFNTQVKDILKIKDTQISSLTSKLKRIETQEEPDLEESTGKQVTFEEIQALVNSQYPKYAALLPLAKKQIMEATKGMTMDQILSYVKQFTGNKQSQGIPDPQSAQFNPDYA